jgi:uncharacterized lipoprotein YddW (UPF0748 family)
MVPVEETMVRESLSTFGRARRRLAAAIALGLASCVTPQPPSPPPAVGPSRSRSAGLREFRGAWVASVANIDWPTKPGLTTAAQIAEIRAIVASARATGLNALILQVRPAADALYVSALEPWSEYLTGFQGKPPEPFYDPLKTWIDEAHRSGIELHAWFNPYRARHPTAKGALASSHIAVRRPDLAMRYGDYVWLDPGEPDAARHSREVILDVVRRYDVDGVHIDDYFYPYPVRAGDVEVEFPDDASWQRYAKGGGALARAQWRRENVNRFVESLNAAIHVEKPWLRFGVSPFGIGRPDRRPPGITGFSQFDKLYADVELWLEKGALDYLAPQLYWRIDQAEQAFEPLLEYWQQSNTHARHVWPGLFTSRINATPESWDPAEIVAQILVARRHGANGHIHFSVTALRENRKGIADLLASTVYATPALTPSTPWLPAAPRALE